MYVVAKGALRVRVGAAGQHTQIVGPGTILNSLGYIYIYIYIYTYIHTYIYIYI